MITWAKIAAGLIRLFNWITGAIDRAQAEDYGRLKEREKQAEADEAVRDAIDRFDPGRVPDDEAFGSREPRDDLHGAVEE